MKQWCFTCLSANQNSHLHFKACSLTLHVIRFPCFSLKIFGINIGCRNTLKIYVLCHKAFISCLYFHCLAGAFYKRASTLRSLRNQQLYFLFFYSGVWEACSVTLARSTSVQVHWTPVDTLRMLDLTGAPWHSAVLPAAHAVQAGNSLPSPGKLLFNSIRTDSTQALTQTLPSISPVREK